jgi:hypothetical protein
MIKVLISLMVFLYSVSFVIASEPSQDLASDNNLSASDFSKWSEVTGVNSASIVAAGLKLPTFGRFKFPQVTQEGVGDRSQHVKAGKSL